MPDARGNIKGISLSGKAAEAWERIFGSADVSEETRATAGELVVEVADPLPQDRDLVT